MLPHDPRGKVGPSHPVPDQVSFPEIKEDREEPEIRNATDNVP